MVLEFRNPLSITSLEKFAPSRREIIKQSRFNVSSLRNVEANHHGSYRYLTHTTDKARWNERQGV